MPTTNKGVRALAKKLQWRVNELRLALDEFRSSESSLIKDDLINVCVEAQNPDIRFRNATIYFINHIEEDGDSIAELISDLLLKDDPCFRAIAIFNLYDFYLRDNRKEGKIHFVEYKRPASSYGWTIGFPKPNPSFIHWMASPSYVESDYERFPFKLIRDDQMETLEDIAFHPERLKYKFIDMYLEYLRGMNRLNWLFPEPATIIDDLQPLFRRVIERAGFLAFNVEVFRQQVNYFSRFPDFRGCNLNLKEIIKALLPQPVASKMKTQRKYWLWFVFIEILQRSGVGVRPSFRQASKVLLESAKSLQRRYYAMKETIESEEISLDKVIKKHNLGMELKELLIKAGLIEEESLFGLDLKTFESLNPILTQKINTKTENKKKNNREVLQSGQCIRTW